jgi:hypothetical protein
MVWAPTSANREKIKFWLDCLQGIAIAASIVGVALTYYTSKETERRDSQKPFNDEQLQLYVDASGVLAQIGVSYDSADTASPVISNDLKARFFELYYGKLALVEFTEITKIMNLFCKKVFPEEDCSLKTDEKSAAPGSARAIAISMSKAATNESSKNGQARLSVRKVGTQRRCGTQC